MYIEYCIESCLNQKKFSDYEIIVIDDGSTDNTVEIVERYINKIRFYQIENPGIEVASNLGISKSNGEFIVRIDAYDKIHEEYLKETVSILESNQHYDFVYSNYYVIDEKDQIKKIMLLPKFEQKEIKKRGDFLATGTLFRKKALFNVGLYSESVKNCGLENYELILKLLDNGSEGMLLEKPLFYYRHHHKNLSKENINSIIVYGNKIAVKYGIGKYSTNKYHPYGLKI